VLLGRGRVRAVRGRIFRRRCQWSLRLRIRIGRGPGRRRDVGDRVLAVMATAMQGTRRVLPRLTDMERRGMIRGHRLQRRRSAFLCLLRQRIWILPRCRCRWQAAKSRYSTRKSRLHLCREDILVDCICWSTDCCQHPSVTCRSSAAAASSGKSHDWICARSTGCPCTHCVLLIDVVRFSPCAVVGIKEAFSYIAVQ